MSWKRIITLSSIVGITIAVTILLNKYVPGQNNDVSNLATMVVEIGIGAFIAFLLYFLQSRTDDLRRSILNASLGRVDYLMTASNVMGIDKDVMTSMEKTQQKDFVEKLLRQEYDQSVFRTVVNVFDQLERETSFIRDYMEPERHKSLEVIIEKIRMLYGKNDFFPKVEGDKKVERWNEWCEWTLRKIEEMQEILRKIKKKNKVLT
jgi:hypothetical protein